jgi:lipopolysaccharide exporter
MNQTEVSATSPNTEPPPERSLRSSMMHGAAWMFVMRMSVRFIGLVNTMILARLLAPEEFGLVAMAMIVVAFVDAFNDMGLDMALIRERDLPYSRYKTAWTLSVVVGAVNASLLAYAAPFVAAFYEDPRLENLIYAMALLPLINGMNNPRVADFRREMMFSKDFKHQIVSRLSAFPVAVIAAFVLQSYWALVVGMLANGVASLVVGYVMRPFLPTPSLVGWRKLLGFSIWVQIRSVGLVLASRFDQLVIGKTLDAGDVGGYRVCQEIAQMATVEAILPLGRALLPGYSALQDSEARRRRAFLMVLGGYGAIALALGGGLFCLSSEVIVLLLGAKWIEFAGVFQLLVVAAMLAAISGAGGPFLVSLGQVRTVALISWIRLGLVVAGLSAAVPLGAGLTEFASVRVLVSLVMLAVVLRACLVASGASAWELVAALHRPVLAMLAMGLMIEWGIPTVELNLILELVWKVFVGAVTYIVVLELLWLLGGRPDGFEKETNSRAWSLVRRSFGYRVVYAP